MFDHILNIRDGEIYTFFKNFKENVRLEVDSASELTPDQAWKLEVQSESKHSTQQNLILSESSKLRRTSSTSEEMEKRELDKLTWRDEHCDNPSAA